MIADQRIYCRGEQLTRGSVEACIITLSGKLRRIPSELREKLTPFLSGTIA
jgi:acyl-CoA thioester hydrolase